MYTQALPITPTIIKTYKWEFFFYLVYVSSIAICYKYLGYESLDIKMSISTVLGFAVAILLGFRTASAYDRWWEARKVWGAIVNDSRTWVRQLLGFAGLNKDVEKLALYQAAWCHALSHTLRKEDPFPSLERFLSRDEIARLRTCDNIPNELLLEMEFGIRQLRESNKIDAYQFVSLDQTLKHLCDHMGKCERIKNTVFPIHYRQYVHFGSTIFLLMLPFGMLASTGLFSILICAIVAIFFAIIEAIAFMLQDPFEARSGDTPMTALSVTIERNLRQMIDNEDLPEKAVPDNHGILM